MQPGEEVSDLNPDETTPNGPGTTSTSTDANPGGIQYFFRGTSKGYPGNPSLQRLGVSPASTDPVVSTVFATESDAFGEGVVYIATPEDLSGVEIGPGNVRAELESEVSVWISPSECAERASMSVDSGDARSILESMGISIPRSINTREFGTGVLQGSPRLSSQEIEQFIQLVRKLLK